MKGFIIGSILGGICGCILIVVIFIGKDDLNVKI